MNIQGEYVIDTPESDHDENMPATENEIENEVENNIDSVIDDDNTQTSDENFNDDFHAGAVNRQNPERSLELAKSAALTAAHHGGFNIIVLDMTERSASFDYFVIATGTSRRQLHAMSEEIDHELEDRLNDKRMNIDGYDDSRWIVLDYGTVLVHMFDEETRQYYSLEALWSDAPKLDINDELKAVNPDSVPEDA